MIAQEREVHQRNFPVDSRRIRHLVNFFEYSDAVASEMHMKPRLVRWLLRSPRRWWLLLSSPWTPFQYLVESDDASERQMAFARIAASKPTNHYAFQVLDGVVATIDVLVAFPLLVFGLWLMYHLTMHYPWGWGLI